MFQHTAARRRLGNFNKKMPSIWRFNTQPPEGGWVVEKFLSHHIHGFQHTAARRRLALKDTQFVISTDVSTHSRPKAAGLICHLSQFRTTVSTHSRPKAAGIKKTSARKASVVSTHSRPKAAGSLSNELLDTRDVSTHSRPKAAGAI